MLSSCPYPRMHAVSPCCSGCWQHIDHRQSLCNTNTTSLASSASMMFDDALPWMTTIQRVRGVCTHHRGFTAAYQELWLARNNKLTMPAAPQTFRRVRPSACSCFCRRIKFSCWPTNAGRSKSGNLLCRCHCALCGWACNCSTCSHQI